MIAYTISVTGANEIADEFGREVVAAPQKVQAITERNGKNLLKIVQSLSPFATGEYRRSHQIALTTTGAMYSAEVFTMLERAGMLEFGGSQVMADGTVIDRPPTPHYRPAFEFVSKRYFDELVRYMQP